MTLHALSVLWNSGITPMENHLWQSTLFLLVAAVLAFALRKNQARVRHWIWLSASLKFLLPLSLLFTLGSHLATPRASTSTQAIVYSAADSLSQPFVGQALPVTSRTAPSRAGVSLLHWLPAVVTAIWLGGILVLAAMWVVSWIRISLLLSRAVPVDQGPEVDALRRMESRLGVAKPIRMVLSPDWMEPGIFGAFRPVLIWPQGISLHLNDLHIDAILAHEIHHVRRRDNLTAMLHMLVEAIFWFHPLVWWVGSSLGEERELACDEEVTLLCRQPQVYAESILRVCKFCSEAPLACVSGIAGADLKKRIVQIMSRRVALKLDFQRKVLLAILGLAIVVVPIAMGQIKAAQAGSETELVHPVDPMPAYEVATVKPWDGKMYGRPLRLYIQSAFGIASESVQRLIGPDWIDKKAWVVAGKPSAALRESMDKMTNDDRGLMSRRMAQSLLADRFKLKVHFETREMLVFELVPDKGGVKIKETAKPDPHGGASMGPSGQLMELKAVSAPMSGIMMMLALDADLNGAPVVDKTGLTGKYDLYLQWLPSRLRRVAVPGTMLELSGFGPPPAPDAVGPSLSDALQQIGLKLVRTKGPVEVVVIDHIEEPTEN